MSGRKVAGYFFMNKVTNRKEKMAGNSREAQNYRGKEGECTCMLISCGHNFAGKCQIKQGKRRGKGEDREKRINSSVHHRGREGVAFMAVGCV